MRWRHLHPGELDHERLWLAVTVCAAFIGWGILASGLPTPRCIWHEMTGFPCPCCGGTRTARHLLAGRLDAALSTNPLVFLAFAAVLLYDIYAASTLLFRLPRLRLEEVPHWLGNGVRIGTVAALLANWAWLITRRM